MARRANTPRPTIYDVAKAAGVSKSLVSLVLNQSPLVSDEKREAVQRAIAELGYRPSRAAANLAAASTRTVGLVVDDFDNPWFVDLLDGLRATLAPEGYHVAIQEHYELDGTLVNAISEFLDSQVDALVVAAEPHREFPRLPVPVVLEGMRLTSIPGADQVIGDEAIGIGLALDHLRELGHTRIGHVTGAGGSAAVRLAAYTEWMAAQGEHPQHTGTGNATDEEGGYLGTRALLVEHPDVTAVLAANDTMALGARAALREAGLQVPADVSLVGYDNSRLASSRFLDLTTVDSRGREAGVACARAVLAGLRGDDKAPDVTIAPRLVVRSSTAPPRP